MAQEKNGFNSWLLFNANEMFLGFCTSKTWIVTNVTAKMSPSLRQVLKKQAQSSLNVYQISPLDMDDISPAESSLPNTPSLIKLTLALGSAEGSVNCIRA